MLSDGGDLSGLQRFRAIRSTSVLQQTEYLDWLDFSRFTRLFLHIVRLAEQPIMECIYDEYEDIRQGILAVHKPQALQL